MSEDVVWFDPSEWPHHEPHWTDPHIFWSNTNEEWIGYDEAGLEYTRNPYRNQVVAALIHHGLWLNGGPGVKSNEQVASVSNGS